MTRAERIMLKSKIQFEIREVFLDYFNNFLSIEAFANYYGFSIEFAKALIKESKRIEEEWE